MRAFFLPFALPDTDETEINQIAGATHSGGGIGLQIRKALDAFQGGGLPRR
jgi:hypothetical protein